MIMYQALIFLHSTLRWFVLLSLIFSIFRACKGYFNQKDFSQNDNRLRHWTATIAHIQLMIGIMLYTQSPIIKYFWNNFDEAAKNLELLFFGLFHMVLMLIAIVVLTIGSALAKRKPTDQQKFKVMLIYFSLALFLILLAIPWPFSPLAHRPFFR
jgi:uncharacterized membrane protein YfcA